MDVLIEKAQQYKEEDFILDHVALKRDMVQKAKIDNIFIKADQIIRDYKGIFTTIMYKGLYEDLIGKNLEWRNPKTDRCEVSIYIIIIFLIYLYLFLYMKLK